MIITVNVSDKIFGSYEEKRSINNQEELDALIQEMKRFPRPLNGCYSTTITLTGFDGNGVPYFNQIL